MVQTIIDVGGSLLIGQDFNNLGFQVKQCTTTMGECKSTQGFLVCLHMKLQHCDDWQEPRSFIKRQAKDGELLVLEIVQSLVHLHLLIFLKCKERGTTNNGACEWFCQLVLPMEMGFISLVLPPLDVFPKQRLWPK